MKTIGILALAASASATLPACGAAFTTTSTAETWSTMALRAATPIGGGSRRGGVPSASASARKQPWGIKAPLPARRVASGRQDVVVIDPDFKLAWMFVFAAAFIYMLYPDRSICDANLTLFCQPTLFGGLGSFIHAWFAAFLFDRTNRCRVIFNDRERKFEIKNIYKEGSWSYGDKVDGYETRTNYVVGGPSGWKYDTFVNYEFFPSVNLPLLVYFKEDGTPKSKWNVGPGKYDTVGGGMVHFFPAFGNSYQIQKEFEKRNLKRRYTASAKK